MKIAITGDTYGIGLELKKIFESAGHTVVGFSRATGYDISRPADQDRIVEESKDCEIFLNNAYSEDNGFAQVELLFKLHNQWKGQDRRIINFGSSITMRWSNKHPIKMYRSCKKSLDEATEFLNNDSSLPRITMIKPCATKTPGNERRAGSMILKRHTAQDVADLIAYCILHPTIQIAELSLFGL